MKGRIKDIINKSSKSTFFNEKKKILSLRKKLSHNLYRGTDL